jgi:hypothetical protein
MKSPRLERCDWCPPGSPRVESWWVFPPPWLLCRGHYTEFAGTAPAEPPVYLRGAVS